MCAPAERFESARRHPGNALATAAPHRFGGAVWRRHPLVEARHLLARFDAAASSPAPTGEWADSGASAGAFGSGTVVVWEPLLTCSSTRCSLMWTARTAGRW